MKNIMILLIISISSVFSIIAYAENTVKSNRTYTLYRNAPSTEKARIHVATFDSIAYSHGDKLDKIMNKRNCELVATMYQERPMWEKTKFWCEKGKYRQ